MHYLMSDSVSITRTTISIDSEIMKLAKSKADSRGLKFSNYLEELMDRDIREIQGANALEELAREFHPSRAQAIKSLISKTDGLNQPLVMMRLFDALIDCIEDNGERVLELMAQFQFTLELHFHKPIKGKGFGPKKTTSGYSVDAYSEE